MPRGTCLTSSSSAMLFTSSVPFLAVLGSAGALFRAFALALSVKIEWEEQSVALSSHRCARDQPKADLASPSPTHSLSH